MAFARSASGPAGLSINTGAANTLPALVEFADFCLCSIFPSGSNSSSQPPAAGGLFGAASATQPTAQSNSLFGNTTTTSQPAQATSLFGTSTNTAQQQTGGGGLFGSSMATPKPGGLFGGSTTATGGGGGLFGQTANATQQPAQTGTSLFGSTATQQPAAGNTGGGLFGQPKPAGSLFGGSTMANAGQTGMNGGLFGQQQAAPAAGGGLFGQSAAAPTKSLFSSLNQPPAIPQQPAMPALGSTMGPQVIPGVRIDISNLRNTTRFNDLQEDLQREIAAMDAFIQSCMAQKDQVDAFIPQHEKQLESIPDDVRFVSRKYAAVDSALGADLQTIKQMRDQVKGDAEEAKLSFLAANNLALPSQYHVSPSFFASSSRAQQEQQGSGSNANGDGSQTASEDLVGYFSRATDEMDEQIKKLQGTVKEIDAHLSGVEQNISDQASRLQASNGTLGGGAQDDRVMELYHVLRDFEESIVQVATVVGAAREGVTELQINDFRGKGMIGSY
ncbi:hypothetical protein M406DRAFT_106499 [Cryphonectria parasitica EP155]|uniref:Uncharacterized protein n=1 Tax=Cryphonectria parasitica (strain ATCC 38755 / EP155) TaxID=660469 RepID=A0A9P4Y5S7_CRYP1|nr:uncharacterized protein M406DRAFT_106499 [Cryphonectria parasitica EP155]KAF3767233.1 hypothetical protein M406DRAFT_106499 [Cryphonectria parasitica EP155]